MLRELSHGWLEELTMQTLRTRLIERLRAADVHGRFRVYYRSSTAEERHVHRRAFQDDRRR